jgi:hypothetical protein
MVYNLIYFGKISSAHGVPCAHLHMAHPGHPRSIRRQLQHLHFSPPASVLAVRIYFLKRPPRSSSLPKTGQSNVPSPGRKIVPLSRWYTETQRSPSPPSAASSPDAVAVALDVAHALAGRRPSTRCALAGRRRHHNALAAVSGSATTFALAGRRRRRRRRHCRPRCRVASIVVVAWQHRHALVVVA